VPIFEAQNEALSSWEYQGVLFQYPKHLYRNFEVPELRPLGDKWIFLASSDAPVDKCVYFLGDLDLESLKFIPKQEGVLDYSGHYYAQETIQNDQGHVYVMAWIPGWDREWLPTYMNEPLKNDGKLWNGCFAIPRKLSLDGQGNLIQQPVETMIQLRDKLTALGSRSLPVTGPMTGHDVLTEIHGNQMELQIELDLNAASFCGLNLLCDQTGNGGMFIVWSGNILNVDGVSVPIRDWIPGDNLQLQIFIDKQLVEVFVNGGKYCISRKVRAEKIKGDRISLTRLGGTARLISLKAWNLKNLIHE
jgi:beta-fructofuranosidase